MGQSSVERRYKNSTNHTAGKPVTSCTVQVHGSTREVLVVLAVLSSTRFHHRVPEVPENNTGRSVILPVGRGK
jgi:hypothetical protein